MFVALLLSGMLASASDPCAPLGAGEGCMRRGGQCFDLAIDGTAVVPLTDATKRAELEDALSAPVCWTMPAPVRGELDAVARPNALTADRLGGLYDELEVVVTALANQQVPTRKGIRTDPTVRIGGVPMQTAVDVVDVAALPDGPYVVTFRVRGPDGWDRKAVYLQVARSGAK